MVKYERSMACILGYLSGKWLSFCIRCFVSLRPRAFHLILAAFSKHRYQCHDAEIISCKSRIWHIFQGNLQHSGAPLGNSSAPPSEIIGPCSTVNDLSNLALHPRFRMCMRRMRFPVRKVTMMWRKESRRGSLYFLHAKTLARWD